MTKRALPLASLAALAIAISLVCVELAPARSSAPVEPPPPRVETPQLDAPTDYSRALLELNRQLRAAERSAERYPGQWLRIERVAGFYLARARLTGDHDDYLRAQRILDEAFTLAPEGAGPLLSRAHLNFTLHRVAAVEPDLARAEQAVIVRRTTHAEIAGLRGDVAFHSGRFEEAERLHRGAEEMHPTSATAFRVAYDLWQTGRFEQAERWLGTAESRVIGDGQERAWMELQRGLLDLDRGQLDEALGHYRRADRLFAGWWLVEEHIAEIHALRGEHDEAERRYRDLIERTNNPEFMDALAGVLEARGRAEEARALVARATTIYEHQLEVLPEASYGHALEHFLEHGTAARALDLARANHALRPGGEATVRLAQALYRSGELGEARTRIDALLATPYRTAALHATAARVFEASVPARSAAQARLARAIDPGAIDDLAWLRAEH